MKKIGIILRQFTSNTNKNLLGIKEDLILYLRRYPIQIICIPICFQNNESEEFRRVEELIKECNGIIFPGGSEFFPIDIKIIRYLHENDIPTLGLCLGMQTMACAFNGSIDYLPNNNHQSNKKYVHPIIIKNNTKLHKIIGKNEIMVNSRHSEYINNTSLTISAISNDHFIEAIEDDSKKFFIGVQWHPESLLDDLYSKKLFDAFIDAL